MSDLINPNLIREFDEVIKNTEQHIQSLKRIEEIHAGPRVFNEKNGVIETLQRNIIIIKINFLHNILETLHIVSESFKMLSVSYTSNKLGLKVIQMCVKNFDDAMGKMICGAEKTNQLLSIIEEHKDKKILEINNYYNKKTLFKHKIYELKQMDRTLNSPITDKLDRHVSMYQKTANVIRKIMVVLDNENIFRMRNDYIETQKLKNQDFENKKFAPLKLALKNAMQITDLDMCAPAAGGTKKASRKNLSKTRKYGK